MKLAENFIFKPNKTQQIILGCLGYASARLYNVGNYERKNYSKDSNKDFPDWYKQKKELKDHFWYKNLPSQTAQETLKILSDNWKSYFKSIKDYKSNPDKYTGKPKPPSYKPKDDKFNFRFLNNGFKVIDNKLRLSLPKQLKNYLKEEYSINQKFLWIKVPKELLSDAREHILNNTTRLEFKPLANDNYKLILIYKVDTPKIKLDNNNYLSIDLGINNLAACYSNKTKESFILDGGQYLSISRYFNKKIKHFQSILNSQGKKTSKRLKQLYQKRDRQIRHLIHAATKKIVNYCIKNNINRVIVGNIKGIRKDNNIGKVNNQKLHQLPYDEMYHQLEYKLKLKGINLIKKNEAYTSQCSPYTKKVNKKYAQGSNRKERGLYLTEDKAFNADVIGAFNILRKYLHQRRKGPDIDLEVKGLNNLTKYSWNRNKFVA
jgi:IS605 OrfB family transposase